MWKSRRPARAFLLATAALTLICAQARAASPSPGPSPSPRGEHFDSPASCGDWVMPVAKRLPVRNQGSLGTCYAETGAAMYDALWLKHHSGLRDIFYKSTDPYQAAFALNLSEMNTADDETGIETGQACKVLDHLIWNSGCRAAQDDLLRLDPQKRLAVVQGLEDLWLRRNQNGAPRLADNLFKLMIEAGNLSKAWDRRYRGGADLLEAAKNEENQQEFVFRLTAPRCAKRFALGKFLGRGEKKLKGRFHCATEVGHPDQLLPRVDGELNYPTTREIPIGIGYCGYALKKDRPLPEVFPGSRSADCGRHASMIIGRRYNRAKSQCEYLVRNSWGRSCDSYRDVLGCSGDGNIWVPRWLMRRALYKIQTAKPSNGRSQNGLITH